MSKPHLLYISFSFPPSTASSVYRCTAVANNFVARGWDVTVVTMAPDIWSEISGADWGLVDAIDPRIEVVHVGDGGAEEPNRRDLRRFSRLRIEAPYLWKELYRRKTRGEFPEDFHSAWYDVAYRAAAEIQRRHPADLIMGSASPYVSFQVAQAFDGVPFVLDYRDSWAFNVFDGSENYAVSSPQGQLEADYLARASQIWFVNDPIRNEYARRHPTAAEKMRTVSNGFDPQPGHRQRIVRAEENPRFGYLGTLQYSVPLNEFLAGWDLARNDRTFLSAEAIFRGKLSPTGATPPELLDVFDSRNHPGLSYQGPISKREVSTFYNTLDALLLLLAPGKYVTGGKTAEYVATGLPIVSIHDLGSAATELLRDYPLWFPAQDLSVEKISAALLESAEEIRQPDQARWQAAWEYGQRFARDEVLVPVIDELGTKLNRAGREREE